MSETRERLLDMLNGEYKESTDRMLGLIAEGKYNDSEYWRGKSNGYKFGIDCIKGNARSNDILNDISESSSTYRTHIKKMEFDKAEYWRGKVAALSKCMSAYKCILREEYDNDLSSAINTLANHFNKK